MDAVKTYYTYNEYSRQSRLRRAFILTVLVGIFSILGWIAETLLFLIREGSFHDRGLLTLPFCPLYGFGMLLTYALIRTPCSGVWRRLYSAPYQKAKRFLVLVACLIMYSVLAAVIATAVEFITGLIYHRGFNVRLWSYRGYSHNIMGYVSLQYSLLWGVGATACMALVWYPIQNALARLRTVPLAVIAAVLATMIATDFVINTVFLVKEGKRITVDTFIKCSRRLVCRYLSALYNRW